jgi:transposase-like protein
MSAQNLLPAPAHALVLKSAAAAVSRSERRRALFEQLTAELNPSGTIEDLLIGEIARRAALTEDLDRLADELDDEIAETASVFDESAGVNTAAWLAGSGQRETLLRLSIGCSRALGLAVGQLQALVKARREHSPVLGAVDPRFSSEIDCVTYLVRRFQTGEQRCPHCSNLGATWIAARLCWQCHHCKTQAGLRVGTVTERSALPLRAWFAAIRLVLVEPRVGTGRLAELISVSRLATVRRMKRRIREAIASDTATERLAGLDRLFLQLS